MDSQKYAHQEDEQRFLVAELPETTTSPRLIEDRYLVGTRLRLRRVSGIGAPIAKLGHKVKVSDAGPSAVWHTSMYLDDAEFAALEALPAMTVSKRRWVLPDGGSADEFLGDLEGLILIEGDRPMAAPRDAVEVTDDVRFTGGELAALARDAARSFVTEARRRLP
ncbi:MAG TPA: hypothetical protein VIE15_03015 [Acidimicrobiales bacterium]